jgi:hypothetical protein
VLDAGAHAEEGTMEKTTESVTTTDLQSEAHAAAGNLVRAEIALVRKEFRDEIRGLETSAAAFGAASVAGLLGLQALVETLVVSEEVPPWRGIAAGLGLLALAGAIGLLGYRALPKRALRAAAAGNLEPGMQVFG